MNKKVSSMRKALSLAMALSLCATSLVGCSTSSGIQAPPVVPDPPLPTTTVSTPAPAAPEVKKTPLIGISWRADTDSEFYVNIASSIRAAGGIPVLLGEVMHEDLEYDKDNVLLNAADEQGALTPEVAELLKNDGYKKSNAAEVVAEVDAVVFTGGEDISSQLYATPELWHGIEDEKDYNVTRDANDFLLMDYCLDNNIPTLGICRGMQMMSVVSGAKMIQDIPTFMAGLGVEYNQEHRNVKATPDSYRDFESHDVVIEEGSIAHAFSKETLIKGAPSWHHQAVESVEGTNLKVTGTLDVNGVDMIEIVERTDCDFAVGLQYHPEASIDKNTDCQTNAADYMSYDDALEVFDYLVAIARY